jgi:transcriptional regulator with XRE-family HTH domain
MVCMTKVASQLAEFGRQIRRLREELGLTQEQLAARSGLSAIYIGTIENGKRDPSLSTVHALAKGLAITTSGLFGSLPPLSAAAYEVALLFDAAPKELQTAVLSLLQAVNRLRPP